MLQQFLFILVVVFVSYAALVVYYAINWRRITYYADKATNKDVPFISVIIPARDEETNIMACLNALQQQTYPSHQFEILVIDDHSNDRTAALVKSYAVQNLRLISLSEFVKGGAINSYKKKAIEIGIQKAAGELIVTTDADCTMPPCWLQTIAAFYSETDAALIVMPVNLTGTGIKIGFLKSLLVIFQQLDFMVLQGITGASVQKGVHSMCNGANLAYTRKAFYEVDGFAGIDTIASGDDMLLMHKIAARFPGKIKFLKSKQVIVQTAPMDTLGGFFNQRIRWASKADKYDDKRITAVLVLVYFFNVMLLTLMIAAFFNSTAGWFLLPLLLAKTVLELLLLYPVATFFSATSLLVYFPFAQPFHIVYTVIAGWLGKFGTYKWKGRQVK